jgi:hypothetical protein
MSAQTTAAPTKATAILLPAAATAENAFLGGSVKNLTVDMHRKGENSPTTGTERIDKPQSFSTVDQMNTSPVSNPHTNRSPDGLTSTAVTVVALTPDRLSAEKQTSWRRASL